MKTVQTIQFGPVNGEITDLGAYFKYRYRVDVKSHLSNIEPQIFTVKYETARKELMRAIEELRVQISTYPKVLEE